MTTRCTFEGIPNSTKGTTGDVEREVAQNDIGLLSFREDMGLTSSP